MSEWGTCSRKGRYTEGIAMQNTYCDYCGKRAHPGKCQEAKSSLGSVNVIDLQCPMATCCICGEVDVSFWGVPIDTETALICANDYDGDWAAKPACKQCWEKHDAGQFVGHDPAY